MESVMGVAKAKGKAGHNEIWSRQLTGEQLKAIRLEASMGDDIRKNYPEIADKYRSGLTAPELVTLYEFDRRYGVRRKAAISAVRNAIRGHAGFCYEPYQGLILNKSERDQLALVHNSQTGKEQYDQKRGIHALDREQKAEAGRKGGLIRGPLSYRLRIGCHALSPEALRDHCRTIAPLGGKAGGVASVLAKGLVPYMPAAPGRIGEIEFALRLAEDQRYLGPVRANFRKIAEEVNAIYYTGNPYYTRTTLKNMLRSYRRRNLFAVESSADPAISCADKLARDPAYQLPGRINAVEIARRVNEEYHGGKPVRNHQSIGDAIQRYRQQKKALPTEGFLP